MTRLPVAALAAGTAALAAAAWALFPSPGDLLPWLRVSLELAGGYSEAMSLEGLPALTLAGAGSVLSFLGLVAWLWVRRSPAAGLALVFAAPAFLAYKHGFVRQDTFHTPIFFTYLAAVLGLLALPEIDQETGTITLQLRAERSGKGKGREYTVRVTATDYSENLSVADVKIIVPHDKGKN